MPSQRRRTRRPPPVAGCADCGPLCLPLLSASAEAAACSPATCGPSVRIASSRDRTCRRIRCTASRRSRVLLEAGVDAVEIFGIAKIGMDDRGRVRVAGDERFEERLGVPAFAVQDVVDQPAEEGDVTPGGSARGCRSWRWCA